MNFPTFDSFGGSTWRIRRFADEADKRWSAFNPSIAYSPVEGYVVMLRSSNYFIDPKYGHAVSSTGGRVKSNIWVAKLTKNFELDSQGLRMVDFSDAGIKFKRGAEDARLFWRDNSWHFVAGLQEEGIPFPRIGLFKLDSSYKAKLIKVMNDGWLFDVEKNWMPTYDQNENFDYIYGPTSIYRDGVGVVEVRGLSSEILGVRGGSCLWSLDDGTYLAIAHKAYMTPVTRYNPRLFGYENVKRRNYTHCFIRYDKFGKISQISSEFVFAGADIEFAAGLVISGNDVVVSYGYKDVASYLGKIELSKVMEMLNDC